MKVRDIIGEGVFGDILHGVKQSLTPSALKYIKDVPARGTRFTTDYDHCIQAAAQYGYSPDDCANLRGAPAPSSTTASGEPQPLPSTVDTIQNIPDGHRLVVTNPQKNATFYKYPNGQWTDEWGSVMPRGAYDTLDRFADAGGRIEKVSKPRGSASSKVTGFRTR